MSDPISPFLAATTFTDLTDVGQPIGQIFWAMSIPIAALALLLVATLAWRGTRWSSILLPPVIALSLMALMVMLKQRFPSFQRASASPSLFGWQPGSATEWVFWFALPLGLLGAVMNWRQRGWINLAIALVVTSLFATLLAFGRMQNNQWTSAESWIWISVAAGGMMIQWAIASLVYRRFPGVIVPLALTLITILTAATAGFPGRGATIAMHLNVLVATGMVLTAASLLSNYRIGEGTFLVWIVLTTLLFTCTWNDWYSYLPLNDAIPVFAAPLLLLVIFALDAGKPKTRIVALLLIILAALWPVLMDIYARIQGMREAGLM